MNSMLGKVNGVDFWMIISLLMFGVFFLGVIIRLFLLNKNQSTYLSNIPFTENEKNNNKEI